MAETESSPGSMVVGRLTDLAPWEAGLILSLRAWMEGPAGQAEVWNGFARSFGGAEGRVEMHRFETLLVTLCENARRPLVRHGGGCACIGVDEALFCTLVREAAGGDLAEAAAIAGLLVKAGQAGPVADLAAQVGRAMQRMTWHDPADPDILPESSGRVLH
ncbi:hypothetical protein [Citreimonas salinaria]|nr:hypothetical protein [Citreimonas salinaria]